MTQNFKLVPIEPSKDDIFLAMDNAEIAGYDWVDDYRPSIFDVEAILKQYIASAPEVGEAVGFIEVSEDGSARAFLSGKFNNGDKLYTTPQPDRTEQLEQQLAERDEEIERMQSYEQDLNDVIAWMKERGLYWEGDYQQEGADFAAILTEHEQQVSACTEREIKKDNKRLVEALREAHPYIDSSKETGASPVGSSILSLLAEMEAKG